MLDANGNDLAVGDAIESAPGFAAWPVPVMSGRIEAMVSSTCVRISPAFRAKDVAVNVYLACGLVKKD